MRRRLVARPTQLTSAVNLLDRHIIVRFLTNFLLLMGLLFVFAISIDVVVQFDKFADAAREVSERDGRWYPLVLAHAILDFHGPRVFQFFAFMTGLVGIAAAGFTLVQMHRARELVAIMAAGVPLHRVLAAILVAQFGVVVVQLLDQEFVLPHLASKLVREHDAILQPGIETFEVPLMRDADGDLLYLGSFDPRIGRADSLLVLTRDDTGTASARITAPRATWDAERSGWSLEEGRRMAMLSSEERLGDRVAVDFWATDLSPRMLQARRSLNFAQMLSLSQLRGLRDQGSGVDGRLERTIFGRFSGALVNILVPAIVIPFFLLRSPAAGMLQQSLRAAAVAIPLLIGAVAAMTVAIPGLPPAVGAFVPVVVLLPLAVARLAYLRT